MADSTLTENDLLTQHMGFRGYDSCPEDDCPTPFMCSERGDCPWDHEVCVLDDHPCSYAFCPVTIKRIAGGS